MIEKIKLERIRIINIIKRFRSDFIHPRCIKLVRQELLKVIEK
jgi:hypothetical protein